MSYGGRTRYGLGVGGLGSSSISSPGIYSHSPAVSSLLRLPSSHRESSSPSRLSPGGLLSYSPSYASASIPSTHYTSRPRSPLSSSTYLSPCTDRSRSPKSVSPVSSYSPYTPKDVGVTPSHAPTYSKKYYGLRPSKSTSSVVSLGSEPKSTTDRNRNSYGSSSSLQDGTSRSSRLSDQSRTASPCSSTMSLEDDANVDFKKLYFEMKEDNDKLKKKLSKSETELDSIKKDLQKIQRNLRNSSNDGDKRERRALERKVSELEEEVKEFSKVESDNQRLREENKALVRVISKLSK